MTVEIVREMLGWSAVINLGILVFWFLAFTLIHDLIYRIHGSLFKLSVEKFDAIQYAGMAFFKLCIFLFNIAPYLALRIVD